MFDIPHGHFIPLAFYLFILYLINIHFKEVLTYENKEMLKRKIYVISDISSNWFKQLVLYLITTTFSPGHSTFSYFYKITRHRQQKSSPLLNHKHLVQNGFKTFFYYLITVTVTGSNSCFRKMLLVQQCCLFGSNNYDHDKLHCHMQCKSLTERCHTHIFSLAEQYHLNTFSAGASWTVFINESLGWKPLSLTYFSVL